MKIVSTALAFLTALCVCAGSGLCEEEGSVMNAVKAGDPLPVVPEQSYKKEGENNPLYTQRFGADPGVMEYNGRLYVYMTNDTVEHNADMSVKENSYRLIKHISCISSDDLVNWTDHGLIPVAGASGVARWAGNSWAPCAAHKTVDGKEKFFLYFCNGGNGIGVLTADSPVGPWEDPLGKPLIDRSVPTCADIIWLFDPAVMVDEDGTGYLAFGGGVPEGQQAAPGTGRIVRLSDDMIHLDGDPVRLDVPWLFEDSGINRIGDTYVYSYCSNWQTEGNSLNLTSGAIQYMTSSNPLGPYTWQGELFPNEGRFFGLYGNNHHSIAELNGSLYLFYHSRPVEQAMGITGNYRSPQVDRITVKEDGSLQQVRGTMAGVSQLKPLDPFREVPASTMANQAGIRVKTNGSCAVSGSAGCWLKVAGVDFASGSESLSVRASSEGGAALYVLADSLSGPVSAVLEIPAGGELTEISVTLSLSGSHDLFFVFGADADFLSWQAH